MAEWIPMKISPAAMISPDNAKKICDHLKEAQEKKLLIIPEADHGFGLWDNQPDQSERLVDVTSKFLGKNL